MKKTKVLILILLFVTFSCNNQDRQKSSQRSIQMREVCSLAENMSIIDSPLSLDVASDGSFLVSDGSNIVGYDSSGTQTFVWNKKGRGPFEYLVSQRVRRCLDTIYVWDSGSTRLLAYDLNGNGLWAYNYDSAMCDFVPTETSIFIYPCGKKWKNVIQELDLKTKSVIRSYGLSSMAHKAFQSADAAVPLTVHDGTPYFMTRDRMDLYQVLPDGSETASLVEHFESDSFHCEEIEEDLFAINPHSGIEFILQNSFVVSISVNGASYKILTAEGAATPGRIQPTGKIKIDNDHLVFRLYQISKDSLSVSVSERYFNPSLISERDGTLYVLKEESENENATYQLLALE